MTAFVLDPVCRRCGQRRVIPPAATATTMPICPHCDRLPCAKCKKPILNGAAKACPTCGAFIRKGTP